MKEDVCPLCGIKYEDAVNKECLRKTGMCESCYDDWSRWESEGGHL